MVLISKGVASRLSGHGARGLRGTVPARVLLVESTGTGHATVQKGGEEEDGVPELGA